MSILVVSPHIDDETLGAGGTILRYKSEGKKIFWLNFTNKKEEYGYSKKEIEKRNKEIEMVNLAYNFDGFYDLGLKPSGLDTYNENKLIEMAANVVNKIKPEELILPYEYDIHSDHGIVYKTMFACSKTFRYTFIKKIIAMEIVSETNFANPNNFFSPNYFVNITDFLEKKIEIMDIYKSELGIHPFPRSKEVIRALATLRGSESNKIYSEAFMLIKNID